jgi:hypothetical protein
MSMTIHPSFIASAVAEAIVKHKAEMIEAVSLVSIKQAATMLDVTPATVRRLLGVGVDVGGKGYKVRISDINRILSERTIRL